MGHWYCKKTGEPRYTVPYADKARGERDTTLSDAKKLGLVPSVTTILAQLDKPALVSYKLNKLLDQVIQCPYSSDVDPNHYRSAVLGASGKEVSQAAERGIELHACLEEYFLTGKLAPQEEKFLRPAIDALNVAFPGQLWVSEKSFAHSMGFGGKVDLHSAIGEGVVVDFKTKATDDPSKLKPYAEHHMQMAAYALGLGFPKARRFNLFISTKAPRLVRLTESPAGDKYKKMFLTLLQYWQLSNDMVSEEK